jgi:trk system potassium uptake protein TrkH
MIKPRNLASGLSAIIVAISFTLIPPLVVALLYDEYFTVPSFVVPMIVALCTGLLAYKRVGPPIKLTIVEAMVISSLGWLLAPALGSIPYIVVLKMDFLDAYFEAFSS